MGSSQSNANKESIKSWINDEISANLVVFFSKTYCPYCRKAKDAFKAAGLDNYVAHELDKRDDGDAIMDVLKDMTGARTVPRVFVNGKFPGGEDRTYRRYKNGENLDQCLKLVARCKLNKLHPSKFCAAQIRQHSE